jgi:papain fold toxin 1 (glutamine deamidase) of polymorphic toxin system
MNLSIAHPLPDVVLSGPEWARATALAVLGEGWPTGDESATWDVADQWYALADALTGPRMAAFAAADQIVAGLVGAGIAPDGFRAAWERLSGAEDAPLNALVQIAAELGQLVEEGGREIEAAKLAAWAEVGTLLTELSSLTIAAELSLGAARPAAEGMIAASRVAVEQIYARLSSRLGGEQETRPAAADPAHSARSDQRTIRLKLPSQPSATSRKTSREANSDTPRASNSDARHAASGATPRAANRNAPRAATRATLEEVGGETRRLGSASLWPPVDDAGVATRRLAARRLAGEREVGDETRRLVAPRPAFGRPTIPMQRTAGSGGRAFDGVRREEYADFLTTVAEAVRAAGATAYADEVEAEAVLVRSRPGPPSTAAPGWARAERVPGRSAEGQTPGGLRAAHAVHLKALEDAVPAAGRLPDPRVGRWFSLLNAGGPAEDPTRGVNCLDAVLALFETYQRGRPRVAGARTFDGYAHGGPDRPVGGEWSGVRRIQRATGAEFQNLCPFVGGASSEQASTAVDTAFRNLHNHLHNSGHGAFAFVLTDLEAGGCHAWAAVNQDGAVLFLDPQLGVVSAEEPLYRDVVSMDALVVDGDGNPAPLPYHGAGQWNAI